jgi:hypothetical protein
MLLLTIFNLFSFEWIIILSMLAAVFFIARWIYFDARLRGMNPWLWVLLTVFLSPNFIGLIIYLLVRGPVRTMKCEHCHAGISKQVAYCPSCGTMVASRDEPVLRKNHAKFLVIGILLLFLAIIAGIAGIGIRYFRVGSPRAVTTASSFTANYSAGSAENKYGHKWNKRFDVLQGTSEKTFKAGTAGAVLHYTSEITSGEIRFDIYNEDDSLFSTIPVNETGTVTGFGEGVKYTVRVIAEKAGGKFAFEMK